MLSKSVILQGLLKVILIIKKAYKESYFSYLMAKFWTWFIKLLNKSLIINFLTSNIGPEKGIEESLILKSRRRFKSLIMPFNKLMVKIIKSSVILKFFMEKEIHFLIFAFIIVTLPFIPTSMGLVLCFGAIGLTLLSNIYKGNRFKYPKLNLFFMIFFLLSVIISGIFNQGPVNSLQVFIIYLIFIVFGIFVPYMVNSEEKLLIVLNIITLTTLILGIYGIYQFIFGAPMDEAWIDKDFASNVTRVYSAFGNPNVYGEYLVLVLPVIFALFHITDKKPLKIFYLLVLGLGFGNVLMTLSRGSMLSLAIAIFVLVVLKAHTYFPILVILGLIGSAMLPETIIRRILSIFSGGDTSTNYRKSIYQASINMLKDYYLTGTGLGQFKELYKIYSLHAAKSYHAHNTLLMIFIEKGILGIISFISMIIAWSRDIITTIKYKDDKFSFIAVGIFAGIVGCSIQGMVDHIWHNYDIMLMYFTLLGLGCTSAYFAGKKGEVDNE